GGTGDAGVPRRRIRWPRLLRPLSSGNAPSNKKGKAAGPSLLKGSSPPLSFRELEALARSLLSVFLPLLRARVPGEEPLLLEDRAQRRIHRGQGLRSEEHTSELQSRFDLVCRLLL